MSRTVLVLLLATVVFSPSAFAQSEHAGSVYAAALVGVPWSQGVTEDGYQLYRLPPGGWSAGWSVLGGVFVSPRASVEFEVARTGVLARVEPSRYNMTYHTERQDTFFTTAVRLHPRPAGAIDVEPVMGFDIVREQTWDATEYAPYAAGAPQTTARYASTLPSYAGFSIGADARVGSGHASFIASFRVHRTFWGGDFGETKRWTLWPSAGVRVVF